MKKYCAFSVTLLLAFTSFTAFAQEYLRGDVDRDGKVNIADVSCLIGDLLKGTASADVDQDGKVSMADVTSLIDYLLKGSWPDEPVTPPDGDKWVDLGLPSGTLWATMNVGATSPEEYGDYFAWGDTAPKDYYAWRNCSWVNIENGKVRLTKYCTNSNYGYNGFVDDKTELDPEDDAACVNYPDGRMPSKEQIDELLENCTWAWTQMNGVNGQLITGPNGKTLFFPAAGFRLDGKTFDEGSRGYYWSRSITAIAPLNGITISFTSANFGWNSGSRCNGFVVRAVYAPQQ